MITLLLLACAPQPSSTFHGSSKTEFDYEGHHVTMAYETDAPTKFTAFDGGFAVALKTGEQFEVYFPEPGTPEAEWKIAPTKVTAVIERNGVPLRVVCSHPEGIDPRWCMTMSRGLTLTDAE